MKGLHSIRGALRDYRAEFGLSHTAMLFEFAALAGAIVLTLSGGWTFAVITP